MILRHYLLLLVCLVLSLHSSAHGGLIMSLDDTPSGLRLEYSGTLDVSNLSTTTGISTSVGLGFNERINTINWIGVSTRTFDNPFQVHPTADFFTQNLFISASPSGAPILLDGGPVLDSKSLQLRESDIASDLWTGSGFMQFGNNTDLSWVGATEGVYTWTLNNSTADTIVLTIGNPAVVPEPASMALWGLGSLGIGVIARRRKRKQIAA